MRTLTLPLLLTTLSISLTACTSTDQPDQVEAEHVVSTSPNEVVEIATEEQTDLIEPTVEEVKKPTCLSEAVSAELVRSVIERTVESIEKGHTDRFLQYEMHDRNEPEPMGNGSFLIVFRSGGIRYSVRYWAPMVSSDASLNFWTRPDGTHDDASLVSFSDERLDGCVNFAVGDEKAQILRWQDGFAEDEGVEHHTHWQTAYNEAVRALDRFLGE